MPPTSLTEQPRERVSVRQALLLVLLLAASVVLRLWGVDHSLPHTKERDAHMALHTELLRQGYEPPDPNNNDNQYPILLPGLLALAPTLEEPLESRVTLEDHLRAAGNVYRESRIEMALLSVFAIALTFVLARLFVPNGWALFAASLMSVNLLTQYFAQQARPHAAATAFYLAAVLAAMRLARRPRWGAYVLAAALAMLSIGALHSGLATLLPLAAACFLAALYSVHEPAAKLYRRVAAAPLLPLAVAAAGLALFYPYLHRPRPDTDFDRIVIHGPWLMWGDHRVGLIDFVGTGFGVVLRTLWYYDPALLALLVLALGLRAARPKPIYQPYGRWSDFWVAFAFAGPYLLLIGLFERTFERFLLPLAPYFAVFAAWGLHALARRGRSARLAAYSLATLALSIASFAVTRLVGLRAAPDSVELAAHWIEARLDPARDRLYCVPTLDLPIARNAESLFPTDKRPAGRHSRWASYQARLGADVLPPPRWDVRYLAPRPDLGYPFKQVEADPEGFLRALGPGYYVIDVSRQPARPVFTQLPELLRGVGGQRVARFGPNEGGRYAGWSLPFEDEQVDGWPSVFARLLTARCVGPVLEIYHVP